VVEFGFPYGAGFTSGALTTIAGGVTITVPVAAYVSNYVLALVA
jgi:hypothetical protein